MGFCVLSVSGSFETVTLCLVQVTGLARKEKLGLSQCGLGLFMSTLR